MAIYHLSAKIVSRSTGRSSVSAAAYRSASRFTDQRTGQDHNYTAKRDVQHSEILAPENAPDWMRDREKLWNAVERMEKRRDAQLAREIEVALPRELTTDEHIKLVRDFVQKEFVNHMLIADINIHAGRARDGGEQPHAHIMLTTRELLGDDFSKTKNRDWNAGEKLEGWRSRWADHVNLELQRGGHECRIDHRTLVAQRAEAEHQAKESRDVGDARAAERHEDRAIAFDREPEPKLGPTASTMEKLGHASRRGDEFRAVEARNAERRTLHQQARDLARQIAEVTREAFEDTQRRLNHLAKRLEKAFSALRERAEAVTRATTLDRETSSTTTSVDRGLLSTTASRDELLGRVRPVARDVTPVRERGDLLGKAAKKVVGQAVPDVADLLGRGLNRKSSAKDRSRDDDDRER